MTHLKTNSGATRLGADRGRLAAARPASYRAGFAFSNSALYWP